MDLKKVLVIGVGSIGKRHAHNLRSLGLAVSVHDLDPQKLLEFSNGQFSIVDKLNALDLEKHDAIFICTPTTYHLEPLKLAVQAGRPVFIEKPIAVKVSPELEGINELAVAKGVSSLVGCNMRFHEAIQQLKKVVDSGELGKIYSVYAYAGQYLPSWRIVDYRQTYSAKSELGGGMLLEGIHEFDYLHWIFGEVEEVCAVADTKSNLEITGEDIAEVILKFKNGVIGHIHLDCLQQTKRRGYEVIGEHKTVIWESINNNPEKALIRMISKPEDTVKVQEITIDPNRMYVEEIRYYQKCIYDGKTTMNSINDAIKILQVVEAAKLSVKQKRTISLL